MSDQQKLQDFVDSYTDANGDNPISAAFSLWTIAKTIPIQVLKAGIVGWFFVGISLLVAWLLQLPFLYFVGLQVLAALGFVFLTFFAAFKFISDFVVNAVTELITGILSPIDDMYEVYQNSSENNLSRFQFSKKVVREVVLPRVSDILKFIPMKNRITKVIGVFADKVGDERDDISYEEITDSSVKSMMAKINSASKTTRSIVGKPFYVGVFYYVVLWVVAVAGTLLDWF